MEGKLCCRSLLQPSIHTQLETSIIVATVYTYTVRNLWLPTKDETKDQTNLLLIVLFTPLNGVFLFPQINPALGTLVL